ncbi:MAG: DMT family transporter [Thermosynechococcaceae cyanobacterium]
MTLQTEHPEPLVETIPDVLPSYFLELVPSTAADLPSVEHQVQPNRFRTLSAIAALVVALVSISLSAILVRYGEQELSPYAIAFNRYWITAVVLSGWFGLKAVREGLFRPSLAPQEDASMTTVGAKRSGLKSKVTVTCTHSCETLSVLEPELIATLLPVEATTFGRQWIGWSLLALGALLAGDLVLWAWALTQTSVANATLLANLTPVFTCLMGWLFWGKQFDRRLLIGMAIALVGTLTIGVGDLQAGSGKLLGDGVALLGAFSFAGYLLLLERLQTRFSTMHLNFWSSAIAAGLTLPIVGLTGNTLIPLSWQGWLTVVLLALVCQVLGQGLLAYSLNALSCEFVAIFLLLDPILAALGGWVFFSEALSLVSWLAFAIVLVGIYLASSSQSAVKETALIV